MEERGEKTFQNIRRTIRAFGLSTANTETDASAWFFLDARFVLLL